MANHLEIEKQIFSKIIRLLFKKKTNSNKVPFTKTSWLLWKDKLTESGVLSVTSRDIISKHVVLEIHPFHVSSVNGEQHFHMCRLKTECKAMLKKICEIYLQTALQVQARFLGIQHVFNKYVLTEWKCYYQFYIWEWGVLIHWKNSDLVPECSEETHLYLTDNQIAVPSLIIDLCGELNLL